MKRFLLFLFLISLPAVAQDEINTDRPDETENSSVTPFKRFQFEAGIEHLQSGEQGREFQLPSILWKYGIYKNIELRVITELGYENDEGELSTGLKPVTLGFKAQFLKQKGVLPETALLAQAQVPTLASKDFEETHLAPEVRLLFKNKIGKKLELAYNSGLEWDSETLAPIYVYTLSPAVKLSKKLTAYIENYAYFTPHEHPDYWVDGGLLFLLTKDIQLDIAGGYELSVQNHYHQFFETVGISFRI